MAVMDFIAVAVTSSKVMHYFFREMDQYFKVDKGNKA